MDKSVVEVMVKGVMPTSNGCAIFLGNDEKTYVIYVDQGIGNAISRAINHVTSERPQTHDLMVTLLDGFGAEVDHIVINKVDAGTFFARIIIVMENELGRKIVEIDARPSDSIALALLTEKPIYTARSVMEAVDDMTEILNKILKQDGGE